MRFWRKTLWQALLVIGFVIGLSSTATLAETIVQTSSQATNLGLYGGQPEDIAIDSGSDAVYVANFAPSGIYSSEDKGETWQGLPTDSNYGTGKAVEIDQSSGRIYGLIGDSVIMSDDQGATWTDLTENLDQHILGQVMLFAHDQLLVAGNDGSVLISSDDGDSFDTVTIDSDGQVTSLAATAGEAVYYAVIRIDDSSEKLYRSTDDGQTWSDLELHDHGLTAGARFYEVGVDSLDSDHVIVISDVPDNAPYQTTDGGDTWTAMTNNGDDLNGGYVTFDSTGRVYIGSYFSDTPTDDASWEQFTTDTPLSSIYGDEAAIDPNDDDIIFTNSAMGVAKSIDRGDTWTDEFDGITSVKIYDIAQTADKSVVWLGANGGLAKSTDFTSGTPTWEYPILPADGISNVKAVWVDPSNSDVVIAGLSTFIDRSTDGGVTWTQASAPDFAGQIQDIVQSPLDEDTLYAIHWNDSLSGDDTGGVFESTDQGETWTDVALTDDKPATSLAIGSDGKVYVGIGGDADVTGVYVYDGSSWDLLSGDFSDKKVTSVLVHPDDPETIFVTAEEQGAEAWLYRSTDGGASWDRITDGLDDVVNLDTLTIQTSTSPATLYMSGQALSTLDGVIYKSSDGGDSWSLYYTGLKQESFYAMLFDGLLVGNDRGLYSLKTKARLRLVSKHKLGDRRVIKVRLRDIATHKKLANRKVVFYKKFKKSGTWKKITTAKTNTQGVAKLNRVFPKRTFIQARWKPRKADREEYLKTVSKRITVKRSVVR